MQPLVQSAIDAANQGDNNKALELCKQVLTSNPDDVDAWLVVAAIVDQPERKRLCLNRVLALDPTNQIARDELLDMDRAALGGASPSAPQSVADIRQDSTHPHTAYPTSTSAFESEAESPSSFSSDYPASPSAFEPEPPSESEYPSPLSSESESIAPSAPAKAAPQRIPATRIEKPLVFGPSRAQRILIYSCVVLLSGAGLLLAWQTGSPYSLFLLVIAFLMGILTLLFSPKVEITEAGIRASIGILGTNQVLWKNIKGIESRRGRALRLVKSNGQSVEISNHVDGYPRIIEIIRQKRPDLFEMADSSTPSGQENMFPPDGHE